MMKFSHSFREILRLAERSLFWLFLAVVSWQLRHTFFFAEIGGEYFEYGSLHIYISDGLALILLASWFLTRGRSSVYMGPRSVLWPMAFWLGWQTLSVLWSADVVSALWHAGQLWLWAGVYVYIINRVRSVAEVLWPLLAGFAVQGLVAVGQYVINGSVGLSLLGESVFNSTQGGISVIVRDGVSHVRAYGLAPHPNILAGLMVMGIGWLAWLWSARTRLRYALSVVAAVLVSGLVFSFGRAAWLMSFVLSVVGFWYADRSKRWLIAVAGLFAILLVLSQSGLATERFDLSARLEEKSVADRVSGMEMAWESFLARPVFGVGVGNYTLSLAEKDGFSRPGWLYQPVHNVALLVVAETGVIGLGIWMWLAVAVWLAGWKMRDARWWLFWPLVAWYVLGLVDHWPASLHQGWTVWFIALALIILQNKLTYRSSD